MPTLTQSASIYEIEIVGTLDPAWSAWWNGLVLETSGKEPMVSTLTGPIIDQAKLRGILNQLWDLNLTVLAVRRMETRSEW